MRVTLRLTVDEVERALDEFIIEGVDTSIEFYRQLLKTPEFRSGDFDTTFVDQFLAAKKAALEASPASVPKKPETVRKDA